VVERHDILAGLAEAALLIYNAPDLPTTLNTTVQAAKLALPGIDHVGISVSYRDGRVETVAATDQLVWDLDQLQYELNEGPCLDAINESGIVEVNNLAAHESQWPGFVPRAAALGLRAQMGLRLYVDNEGTLGGLNLYSTGSDVIDPDVREAAELFATHAALEMGHVRREENLNSALGTRKVIGQAIGIVMERYELDEDRAFKYLAQVSQHSNVKLRDVAAELVWQSNESNQLPAAMPIQPQPQPDGAAGAAKGETAEEPVG
jgi:GAF domain-containing protein